MSNQVILWSSVILPWFTLIFMPKEDIKRYMPVALFGSLLTVIFSEVALALHFWTIKQAIFPFYHIPPFTFGGFPVGILWIFKFSDRKFFYFMLANAVFDFILTYPLDSFLISRGIISFININSLTLFFVDLVNAAILYGYQKWQEGALISKEKITKLMHLQPVAAKPIIKKENDKQK